MKNTGREDELRKIAPELSEMKREDGFTTPHNYFKELPDRVFAKIVVDEAPATHSFSWLKSFLKPKYRFAYATVLILIVAGVWYSQSSSSADVVIEISKEDALQYVMNNLHEYSSEDLISAGVLGNWDETKVTPVSSDEINEFMDDLYLEENLELIEAIMN
jgi:hypothetical protein